MNVVEDHNKEGSVNVNYFQQCSNDSLLTNASEVLGEVRSVTHKTSMLDDFELPDYSESQIVTIENKISYVTPMQSMQQDRAKVPGKYMQSSYTDPSDSVGTSKKAPNFFHMKHPFVESINFDVDKNLIDSFQMWIK